MGRLFLVELSVQTQYVSSLSQINFRPASDASRKIRVYAGAGRQGADPTRSAKVFIQFSCVFLREVAACTSGLLVWGMPNSESRARCCESRLVNACQGTCGVPWECVTKVRSAASGGTSTE